MVVHEGLQLINCQLELVSSSHPAEQYCSDAGAGMVQAQKESARGLLQSACRRQQNTCQWEGWKDVYTVKKNETDALTLLVLESSAIYDIYAKCPGHTCADLFYNT